MSTAFLCKVYEELCEEHKEISQIEFSREYLQMCDTYFAHLKSADVQPTTNVLVQLWAKLTREQELFADMAQRYNLAHSKDYYIRKALVFEDLATETEREFKSAHLVKKVQ